VPIDDAKLHTVLTTIHNELTEREATAIIDVARLAASVDKKSDVAEMAILIQLLGHLTQMARMEGIPFPTKAIDEDRLLDISDSLIPVGARELAYACAYLVMASDQKITTEEAKLTTMLGDAMVIDPGRARVLAATMEALVRS